MKVFMINGSPNKEGCTYTALKEVAGELERCGVESEIFHIGTGPIRGCTGCLHCRKGEPRCVFDGDSVNKAIEKAREADGFVFGSPVYYAAVNGSMVSFLNRFFYPHHGYCAFKPAASVVSARRAGTTAAYDQLNKYIGISKMIMAPAPYWNMVHGNTPDEVRQDLEGLFIMRSIGKSMAWMLELLELGKKNGVPLPQLEEGARTNFIR